MLLFVLYSMDEVFTTALCYYYYRGGVQQGSTSAARGEGQAGLQSAATAANRSAECGRNTVYILNIGSVYC